MNQVPHEVVVHQILPFLSYRDLGVLCQVNSSVRYFLEECYAPLLCDGVCTEDMLAECNMSVFELLDHWLSTNRRLDCNMNGGALIQGSKVMVWKENQGLAPKPLAQQVVVSISCGFHHTLALTENNQVFGFGNNDKGQLGQGDFQSRDEFTPMQVPTKAKIAQISAGENHSILLEENMRHLWFCGQLSLRTKNEYEPTKFNLVDPDSFLLPNERIVKVTSGAKHVLLLTNQHRLLSGGLNEQSQLGRGGDPLALLPVELNHGEQQEQQQLASTRMVQIAAGIEHSVILFGSGQVFSFGKSSAGQVGTTGFHDSPMPQAILGVPKVVSVGCGHRHTILIGADQKQLYTFGLGLNGQLGYETAFWCSTVPRKALTTPQTIVKYAAGGAQQSICITRNFDVYTCGKSSLCLGAADCKSKKRGMVTKFTKLGDY